MNDKPWAELRETLSALADDRDKLERMAREMAEMQQLIVAATRCVEREERRVAVRAHLLKQDLKAIAVALVVVLDLVTLLWALT